VLSTHVIHRSETSFGYIIQRTHEVFLGTKEKDGSTASLFGADRRKHCTIFGKSGAGKTTLMRNMIVVDIFSGNGVTVIDPHGGLFEDLLQTIPKSRTNDVVYFNLAERERVIGLNVLESVDRSERSLVVSSLISILRNLYPKKRGAANGIHLGARGLCPAGAK